MTDEARALALRSGMVTAAERVLALALALGGDGVDAARLQALIAARREEIADRLGEIYARHHSREHLAQMLAFFDSPAGQAMLARQPLVEADVARMAQGLIEEVKAALAAR